MIHDPHRRYPDNGYKYNIPEPASGWDGFARGVMVIFILAPIVAGVLMLVLLWVLQHT